MGDLSGVLSHVQCQQRSQDNKRLSGKNIMVKIAETEKIVTAFNGKSLNSTVHAVRLDSDSARRQSAELRSLHYRLGLVAEENRHRLTSQTVTLQGERNAQSGDPDRKEIDGATWPTLHVNAHKTKPLECPYRSYWNSLTFR